MPVLVGTQRSVAVQQIRSRGLTPSVKEEESASPAGEVIRQAPERRLPAAARLDRLDHGLQGRKKKATVPNVIGKLRADAVAALREAGLKPTVSEQETDVPSKVGRVTDQFPPPGLRSRPGHRRHRRRRQGAAAAEPEEEARMKVAVLSGGRSSEHDVSLRSGEAVARGLEEAGHEALRVTSPATAAGPATAKPIELTPGGGLLGADVAFPALHGPFGEDGSAQGLLEWLDLPYVGSDVLSSAICMDKLTLKRLFAQAGLPQVEFVAVGEDGLARALRGAGLAALGEALASRLQRRHQQGRGRSAPSSSRRWSSPCATTRGSSSRPRRAAARSSARCSATRRSRPRRRARSSPTATGTTTRPSTATAAWSWSCPPPISAEQTDRVRELAVEAFRLGGCAGLARCDFFVEPDGEVLVNEINTMPGFTETSVYAKLWEAAGLELPGPLRPSGRTSRSSATSAPALTSSEFGRTVTSHRIS